MKKRLLSILIVNVLFFSNVGFTSLAVEKNMELADTAAEEVTVEASEEGESQESGENTEASVPDSYFDDVEYVKIAAFTQLPEEITDQKIKVGGNVNELNLPDTLEISVVADEDREDRINMQLGRERELIRQLERDAEKEEKEKKTEEKEKEVEEAEKKEASEEGMLLEDGERIIFFDSEGAPIEGNSEKSEEQSAEEYVEEEIISEESTVSESQNVSSPIKDESKTEDKANEAASTEQATTDSGNSESSKTENVEAAPQEQSSEDAGSSNNESTSEAAPEQAPEQAPAESESDGAGTEESSSEENLISKITSVFKALVVHAAEDVEAVEESSGDSVEKTDSESSEENKKEEAAPTEEQMVFEEDTENASENESEAPAEEKAEEKAVEEKADTEKSAETVTGEDSTTAADTSWTGNYEYETVKRDISTYSPEEISVEMVSGIKWILDPLKNEYSEFTTDVVGRQFTFIPVLVIPDYYYVEADLPTIRVTVVEEIFDFDKVVTVDNVKIRVRADKGVFPEGATLFAQKLQEEDEKKVQDAVAGQMEESANIVKSYTFDIQIRDKDGNEIEPDTEKGRVFVSFETEEVSNAELNAEIYHIVETENAGEAKETVNAASSSDSSENTEEKKSDEAAEGEKAETEDKENNEEKASLEGEITVQKLEVAVVEGEENKAVEAVTEGFSTYSLLFVISDSIKYDLKSSILNLENLFDDKFGKIADITAVSIPKADLDFFTAERLALSGTGPVVNTDGLYETSTTGDYFLIVKRLFSDLGEKTITVTYNNLDYPLVITDKSDSEVEELNGGYPYGEKLSDHEFKLRMPVSDSTDDVLFQWQKNSGNNENGWEDIDLANQDYFHQKGTGTSFGYEGKWIRCVVNGIPSNAVQIITPDGDARSWKAYCGANGTQCYISNGTIAYTIVDNGGNKIVFDVVGEQVVGSTKKMQQTTKNGAGWKIFCNLENDDLKNITSNANEYHLEYLHFAFDEDEKVLHVNAKPDGSYPNQAIGATCQIGGVGSNCIEQKATAADGLQSMSVIGTSTIEKAQIAVNDGSDDIYSVKVIPKTPESSYYMGSSSTFKPYSEPDSYADYSIEEASPAAISLSWVGNLNNIKFDISLGGVSSNTALAKITKTVEEYPYYGGGDKGIKSVKVVGSELSDYAKSLGTATQNVDVMLVTTGVTDSTTSSSTEVKAIKNLLPSYDKLTTSGTSSTQYPAEYFDVSIIKTVGKNAPEVVYELPKRIQLEVSFDFTDKEDIRVYRYHKDSLGNVTYSDLNNTPDGAYTIDEKNKKIEIYSAKFSVFGIAYKPVQYPIVTFKEGSTTLSTAKVKMGGKVEKPKDPTKDGYAFAGWSTTSSTSSTSSTSYYNFDTAVTKNLTLYAIFKKYQTVTFDDGSKKWTVKVVNGEKVPRPSPDPTKEGYTFKGWFKGTAATASSSSAYNFDTAVTTDFTLTAGWTSNNATGLDSSKAAANSASGSDSAVNGARAPKTSDDLPVVWLWVLLLVAGVATFGCSLKELMDMKNGTDRAKRPMTKARKILLLIGIVISTTWAFILKKIRQNRLKALVMVGGAVAVVSVIVLATTFFQYHKSETIYSKADKTYVESAKDSEEKVVADGEDVDYVEGSFAENTNWWDCAQVNLKELKKEYPDVVGWIYFENEDISYPVMYSGDNSKYLRTTYTGEKAKAGSIFIDGESTPDFTDPHSIVYGHNMHDLSMFGKLRYYRTNPDYYQDHQYFQIFTEDKVYRYQIFAYEVVADSHDVFWVFGKEPTGYFDMLKEIERDSYCKSGITANEADHVVTLATCTNKDDERLIVSAVRTDEYEYAQ